VTSHGIPGAFELDQIQSIYVMNHCCVIQISNFENRGGTNPHKPFNLCSISGENRDLAKFMISLFSLKFSAKILDVINYVYKDWADLHNLTKNALYAFQVRHLSIMKHQGLTPNKKGVSHMLSPSIL
jgi:hypothetical protein